MKKFLTMALALMMVLSLFAVPTMAAAGDVKFSENFDGYTVSNGKFTDASTIWSIPNEGAVTGADGTGYAIRMTYEKTRDYRDQYNKNAVTLLAGDYTFSVKVKATQAVEGLVLRTYVAASNNTYKVQLPDVPLTTEWQTISQDFTLTGKVSGNKTVQMYVVGKVPSLTYIDFDDVTITEKADEPVLPTTVAVTGTTNNAAYGTVTPATSTVNVGEDVTFTVTPKLGYYVSAATLNGANVLASFDAYKGGTYTVEDIAADATLAVDFAEVTEKGENVATLPAVFVAAEPVTFGKVLDANATLYGVELTKDGVGVTPYHGGSYLYKAESKNANGQFAVEFIGLEAGEYTVRTFAKVDGTITYGAPTTFVVD